MVLLANINALNFNASSYWYPVQIVEQMCDVHSFKNVHIHLAAAFWIDFRRLMELAG